MSYPFEQPLNNSEQKSRVVHYPAKGWVLRYRIPTGAVLPTNATNAAIYRLYGVCELLEAPESERATAEAYVAKVNEARS